MLQSDSLQDDKHIWRLIQSATDQASATHILPIQSFILDSNNWSQVQPMKLPQVVLATQRILHSIRKAM